MTSGRPAFQQHVERTEGSDTAPASHTRKGPERRMYKFQFRQKRKRSRSPAGPRRRRKRTHAVNAHIRFLQLVVSSHGQPHTEQRRPVFAPVSRCVPSQERKRIMIVPPGILNSFWPIFDAPKSGQEKGIGAFRANAYSQQPAVRAAARVCGFWKLTLFSRFPERFDAKFEKSRRKAPCHNGLRRRFDRKSVRFIPL